MDVVRKSGTEVFVVGVGISGPGCSIEIFVIAAVETRTDAWNVRGGTERPCRRRRLWITACWHVLPVVENVWLKVVLLG